MRKWILIVAALLLVATFFELNRRRGSKAVEVDAVEVVHKDLVARVSGSGRVEARRSVSTTANVFGSGQKTGMLRASLEPGDCYVK